MSKPPLKMERKILQKKSRGTWDLSRNFSPPALTLKPNRADQPLLSTVERQGAESRADSKDNYVFSQMASGETGAFCAWLEQIKCQTERQREGSWRGMKKEGYYVYDRLLFRQTAQLRKYWAAARWIEHQQTAETKLVSVQWSFYTSSRYKLSLGLLDPWWMVSFQWWQCLSDALLSKIV